MLNTLDRFKQWCRDWWVRNICAECPTELDLEDWWSTECCEFPERESAEECGAVVLACRSAGREERECEQRDAGILSLRH